MILKKTKYIYKIPTFNMNKLTNEDWNNIDKYKFTYTDLHNSILYPGFKFSTNKAAEFYDKNILNFLVNKLKVFTTPRGNLSKDNNIFVIGQRPGHYYAHLSKSESAWLIGDSAKLLLKLCHQLDIYPYFTNFYHSHYVNLDFNCNNIFKEIIGIFKLYKDFYNIKNFRIVLLGSYKEYNNLINEINKLTDINVNFIRTWHPSYLLRSYSEEKYNIWKNNLKCNL